PATSEVYPPSLHDALPILSEDWGVVEMMALCRIAGRRDVISVAWLRCSVRAVLEAGGGSGKPAPRNPAGLLRLGGKENRVRGLRDRKSTRLNSSHVKISYA